MNKHTPRTEAQKARRIEIRQPTTPEQLAHRTAIRKPYTPEQIARRKAIRKMPTAEDKLRIAENSRRHYLKQKQGKIVSPERKLHIREQKQWKKVYDMFIKLVEQRNGEGK